MPDTLYTSEEIARIAVEYARRPCDLIDFAQGTIRTLINDHVRDIFNLVKNIQDTSLNKADKEKRLKNAETQYGIPFSKLI